MNSSDAGPRILRTDGGLSPVKAAGSLGLSVDYVLREVTAGSLKSSTVDAETRIAAADLADYAHRREIDREATLDAMAEDARLNGLKY